MGDAIGGIVGNLIDAVIRAREAGLSKAEAEREIARAVERGEIVSDDAYERVGQYVQSTRDFEKNGAS
jgi:hypothetical protein